MSLAPRLARGLAHRTLPLWLAGLAVALLLPALHGGFQLDDHFQRFRLLGLGEPALQLFVFSDGDLAKNAQALDEGSLPWWAAPDFRHASLRYLSVLTMQLDYALWPDRPALMHAHSLAWLAALVIVVTLFYRGVLGAGWPAGLAALLYALDDARALPTAYLANRNALVATTFGVAALCCFVRPRVAGSRVHNGLGPLCLALGLAAGEMALAAAAYLVAYALCVAGGDVRQRVRALAPYAVVLAGWAVAYRIGGFGSTHSGVYREPLADPVAYLEAALARIPLLVLGQWTPVPSDLGSGLAPESTAARVIFALGVATLVLLVLLFGGLVRREPLARFFALGATLSLLPVAAAGPQDRLLFFVGLGSFGLLALGVRDAFAPGGSRTLRASLLVLLLVHGLLAPLAMPRWLRFQSDASARMIAAAESLPGDAALAAQDLVLVNPPDFVYAASALPLMSRVAGKPSPRRLRALVGAPVAVELVREDAHTLRARLEPGLFAGLFTRYHRGEELRFAVGERVELSDFSVEILGLNDAGDPDELRYRFAVPLESEALRWLRWEDGRYVPWRPPAPGERVRLPPPRGIFGEG